MPKKLENKEKKTKSELLSKELKKKKEIKKLSNSEYEKKVVELVNKGLTAEKIGENLRKQGFHPREYEKKISEILKEKDLYIHPDLKNIEEKLKRIEKHSEKNKQDKRSKRERVRIYSKLRKLKKYLKILINKKEGS